MTGLSTRAGGVLLREGGAQDIAAVMTVMDAAFDKQFGEAWNAQQCLGILGLPGVWLTIASIGEDAVGFALSRVILDEAELLLLGVSPRFRRRGIGQALLDATMENARHRGVNHLHLEVRQGNPAISLYERNGFSEVGRRADYYRGADGSLFDAFSLTRSLRRD
ncbi:MULTISPECIES: ribosomal protein S18-alanine N-acetyltransferase [Sphingomonadales]|uniref:Ribosomal-protein-alanine N-acetyltransferase n=2 Tax=Edaphosphingomonas TaxID=3423724 RepID=A0A1S1HGN3_9SPHN|nr:ribosomal protein S18-alanine N-acetyltransferase [Sphingomonas sp. MM-1]AGH47985.1 ribosomal-protein-alanine acetyltransferase [Sphingomonas sp. MM-1]OHT20383.1 ribosomal-protein-alanine N-acetyltransferase [Sphingomonas haloaromaticamans]